MPMMDSAMAGPILGNEDGRMMPGADVDNDQDTDMVPCQVCQGTGMVPASEAQNPDMSEDIAEGSMSPQSPVTGRTGSDLASIRDYAENRPAQLQHQQIDEGAAAATGRRVRERMRRPGTLGR